MNWQSVIAMLAVFAAALWLSLRAWRVCRRALSGGQITDCAHCPRSAEPAQATPLVQLGGSPKKGGDEPISSSSKSVG